MSTAGPIRFDGEHYTVAVMEADDMKRAKGAKKYLGFTAELCISCLACVDHCPWHCLFVLDADAVAGEPGAAFVDEPDPRDSQIIFWVDDTECTRCNICVERCPTDCITMDKLAKPPKAGEVRQLGAVG